MSERTRFLLPAKFRFVGSIFFIAGIVAGILRFYLGVKPKLLNIKVFAVYSEYLDEKYLKSVNNNLGEEITIFLIITGLFLIAFSREKTEDPETARIRYISMIISFYLSFLFLLAANFLTFGFAFIYMLIVFSGLPLAAYILVFQFHMYLYRKNIKRANEANRQHENV